MNLRTILPDWAIDLAGTLFMAAVFYLLLLAL